MFSEVSKGTVYTITGEVQSLFNQTPTGMWIFKSAVTSGFHDLLQKFLQGILADHAPASCYQATFPV